MKKTQKIFVIPIIMTKHFQTKLSNQNKQDPVSVSDNNARQTRKLKYNTLSKLQFNFILKVAIFYEIICLSLHKEMKLQASI